jgi:drug/metabolite transporter, DME family
MIGIVLALLSAAASGLSVVLVGRHSRESNAFNVSLLISFVGLVIIWPLAAAFTDFTEVNLEGILLFAVGGILSPGLVRLFYYSGLKNLGPSVNSSIFSVYPLYSSLLAVFLLSEFLTLENWIGVVAIAVGVIFVEMSSHKNNGGNNHTILKNWFFPILGGLTLGLSAILRKTALNLFDAPFLGIAVAYSFSFIPYFVIFAFHKPTRGSLSLRRDLRLFWLAGVGQAIAWLLSFYALSLETVSVVTPLLSIEPLFVAVFAYLYLREQEHLSLKLVASILVTVLGAVLVTT